MITGVILPAYNVACHLPALLSALRQTQPEVRILVVDDGSADDTAAQAEAFGVEVIRHAVNQGKGAALQTGFAWAAANGLDLVFTMDADGQHLPREMQGFLDVAAQEGADVVVGSRMAQIGDMPWLRLRTNQFTSWVVSRLAGCTIPDSQNGFRLFRVAVLAGLPMVSNRFDFESEVLVRLGRRGALIRSTPISSVYADERSSIHPLVDTWRFFRLIGRLIFSREHPDRGRS